MLSSWKQAEIVKYFLKFNKHWIALIINICTQLTLHVIEKASWNKGSES